MAVLRFSVMAQLLIVEDDPPIRVALSRALTGRGHAVVSEATAASALARINAEPPDLVVLDLGLPDMDGLQLLRMLRAVSSIPVIVATARDDERSTVVALDAGADDYVVKPFSAVHLDARIRAVLRRSLPGTRPEPFRIGGLSIDPAARTVELDGADIDLNPKEFDLLLYLAERTGEVVTKRELITEIWGHPFSRSDKTVDVHLSWLRRRLGESGQHPRYLHTLRGAGLKLVNGDLAP